MLRHNSDYLAAPEIGSPRLQDNGPRTVDLREVVRILRRRWGIIAAIAATFAVVALTYVLGATTQYTATATVLVDPRRANVVDTTQTVLSNFGTDDATIESQALLIKSVATLRRVVERMKLAADEEFVPPPALLGTIRGLFRFSSSSSMSSDEVAATRAADSLQQRLKVIRQGTTFLVDINVTSESPTKAAGIANAIADAHFEEQVRSKHEATRIAAGWLSGQIDNLKKRVTMSEKAVEDFRAISHEQWLQKNFQDPQGVSNASNEALVQLHELRREAEANRTLYESYLARYKETSAQENLEIPNSRVVTRASIPIAPSFPKSTLIIGLALAMGLAIGCAAAFLVDYLDRRIKTLDEAEQLLALPALAAVPLVDARDLARRAKRGREVLGRHDPSATGLLPPPLQPPLMRYATEEPASFFAESIRAIRLSIQRALRIKPVQIILVTSAIDDEGKTTVAVNLALSLAAIGIRTLLVDCDMRNPETTRSLCPRASVGLLQVALGNEPIERAILVDRSSGLSVLPAPVNAYSHTTSELMFSDKVAGLFEQLRQRYELIVLDSPPLVPLVDGRALAEYADQIVLALAWDKTPRDAALDAVDLLAPVRDRILGTVLTRVDLHRLRHYDYYSSSAYIKPYTEASLRRGAAL